MEFRKDEFLCLFMIYSANVDYNYVLEEKRVIKEVYGLELFNKMDSYYSNHTESEIFEEILAVLHLHIATEKESQELFENLEVLFIADGKFCNFEKTFVNFLDMLFSKRSVIN